MAIFTRMKPPNRLSLSPSFSLPFGAFVVLFVGYLRTRPAVLMASFPVTAPKGGTCTATSPTGAVVSMPRLPCNLSSDGSQIELG